MNKLLHCYKAKNKDENILNASQSGGMYSIIANQFIENEGIVYACIMNSSGDILHNRLTSKKEVEKGRGSKYVQSKLNDTFNEIVKDLKENLMVVFFGTPCQVAGLKYFLEYKKITIDKLLCVDIICHGVPSTRIWEEYYAAFIKDKSMKNFNFRNKKYGWNSSVTTYENEKGQIIIDNSFNTLFYKHYIVRDSCFNCQYRNLNRAGDITIGDCWGLDDKDEFYDTKGVSLVLINNDKGNTLFNQIKDNIYYKEIDIKNYLQPALTKNYSKSKRREKFWKDYNKKGIHYVIKKYGENDFISLQLLKTKKIIKKIIKK